MNQPNIEQKNIFGANKISFLKVKDKQSFWQGFLIAIASETACLVIS